MNPDDIRRANSVLEILEIAETKEESLLAFRAARLGFKEGSENGTRE